MIQTKVTRTLALAGFVPAGKLSHSYCSLLPALALCLATAAWSQSTHGPRGPHRPLGLPGASPSARPAADTPANSPYQFISIGVQGSDNAQAWGINNSGLVAGNYQDASSNWHGFVWQAGSLQTVDYPGAVYTYLWYVNNQGVAMGYYGDGTAEHAVAYSVPNGTWAALPDIPGYSDNEGYGINDAGVVTGNAFQGSTSVAWIWHPAQSAYSFFTPPEAAPNSTYTSAINNRGQVVGQYSDTSGVTHGFLKQGKTYTTIDAPEPEVSIFANGINNGGAIVGRWQGDDYAAQGFVLTSGGLFTTVDYPGPELTSLNGINDRGDICGGYAGEP
jgi:probable HAF family extracellular repeat protein